MTDEVRQELIELARNSKEDLYDLADNPIIVCHWTAGWYDYLSTSYHICIGENGEVTIMHDSLAEILSHAWRHNTGSIGIALQCCVSAQVYKDTVNLGECPPTEKQIQALAEVCAVLCKELDIPLQNVLTHAELADEDGYGLYSGDEDCRWDLAVINEDDEIGSGGDKIRQRIKEVM